MQVRRRREAVQEGGWLKTSTRRTGENTKKEGPHKISNIPLDSSDGRMRYHVPDHSGDNKKDSGMDKPAADCAAYTNRT